MFKQRVKCHKEFKSTSFLKAVDILLSKPHVINKRLWGNNILFRFTCDSLDQYYGNKVCERLHDVTPTHIEQYNKYVLNYLGLIKSEEKCIPFKGFEIVLTEFLPKIYTERKAYQLILVDRNETRVTFFDVTPEHLIQNLCPNFTYTLMMDIKEIILEAYCDDDSKSFKWLINSLLPQFVKWGEDFETNVTASNFCTESLALVSKNTYYHKYNELKIKYAREIIKIWPECTDPAKFVHEDIAIATYLLLLWETHQSNSTKQTFVDLGCGNGLLVYILTREGHNGVGIDVRKRKIWDFYSSDINLEERTIVPSEISLFPDVDWIIGNHSDELTPWIPVLAARSSYKCNFFVLPCCAYNFDGTKYQRKNSNKSQYLEYLEYIKIISEECGFKVEIDRLKIPSTKRICVLGKSRNYNLNEFNKFCNKIQAMIELDTDIGQDASPDSTWIKDFKARELVERVRNCTQIDKNLIQSIVMRLATYLLQDYSKDGPWSLGKTVAISELVKIVPQDQLKQLKSECGGLQTLIKNNHQIFKVQNGKVQLRYPKTITEANSSNISKKNKTIKQKFQNKPCWFYINHPQGCPLTKDNCTFSHVQK